jgi:hypothetical protein
MKAFTQHFLTWLSDLTGWVRYLVIAILFHAAILFLLATIRVAVEIPTIVAKFAGDPPPPPSKVVDDIDPFAAIRDFDYNGPTLGGGGGTPGKGPGGIPTAAGTTPTEYKATVLDKNAAAADKTVGEIIGVDVGDSAGAIARLQGSPGGMSAPTMGLGEGKFGTSGVYGPGGGGFGLRVGPMKARRAREGGSSMEAEKSVMAALRWLKDHQESNGAWKSDQPLAITGLATLAFLGHGHTPDDAEFGRTIANAFKFIVARVPEGSKGNMYVHAIATYALAEGYGMTQSPSLKEPLQKGVDILVQAQAVSKANSMHVGGWRYTMGHDSSDTSVTGWCVQALHAAKLAGASIPDDVFTKASHYLWNMYGGGHFGYEKPGGDHPTMTPIGILCQSFLGQGSDARIKQSLDKLKTRTFDWDKENQWAIYHWYYLTQANFQGGGSYWQHWNNIFRDNLIRHQATDGHWDVPPKSNEGKHGLAYSTSLCCLMLEVYYRYLPTYQSMEQGQIEKTAGRKLPTLPKLQAPPAKH